MTAPRNTLILNVSPDQAGRHALSQMLKQSGFEVREAATSAEALRPTLKTPDLILVDLSLRQAKLGKGGDDVTNAPSKPFVGALWVANPTR